MKDNKMNNTQKKQKNNTTITFTNKELNGVAGYIGDTWNNDGPIMSTLRNYNFLSLL